MEAQQGQSHDERSDASQFIVHPEYVQNNMAVINNVRVVMSIIIGIAAGVLGFTGIQGFLFYAFMHATGSVALLFKMNFEIEKYIVPKTSIVPFLFAGIGDQIMSYILFWTLFYALIHIY